MAVALVQATGSGYLGQTTAPTQAFGSNNTAGNLLVCGASGWQSPVTSVSTITDTRGNTWQKAFAYGAGGNHRIAEVWYAMNCLAGANTITLTWSAITYTVLSVAEFSGVATSSAFDVGAGQENVAATALPSGNTATALANDLVIGVESDSNGNVALSVGSGFTIAYNSSPSTTQGAMEYKLDSGAAAVQSASFTAASAITAAVTCACFKIAAAGVAAGANYSPVNPGKSWRRHYWMGTRAPLPSPALGIDPGSTVVYGYGSN